MWRLSYLILFFAPYSYSIGSEQSSYFKEQMTDIGKHTFIETGLYRAQLKTDFENHVESFRITTDAYELNLLNQNEFQLYIPTPKNKTYIKYKLIKNQFKMVSLRTQNYVRKFLVDLNDDEQKVKSAFDKSKAFDENIPNCKGSKNSDTPCNTISNSLDDVKKIKSTVEQEVLFNKNSCSGYKCESSKILNSIEELKSDNQNNKKSLLMDNGYWKCLKRASINHESMDFNKYFDQLEFENEDIQNNMVSKSVVFSCDVKAPKTASGKTPACGSFSEKTDKSPSTQFEISFNLNDPTCFDSNTNAKFNRQIQKTYIHELFHRAISARRDATDEQTTKAQLIFDKDIHSACDDDGKIEACIKSDKLYFEIVNSCVTSSRE